MFHDFHLSWVVEVARRLNQELLPPTYYALIERFPAEDGCLFQDLHQPREVPTWETSSGVRKGLRASAVVIRRVDGDEPVAAIDLTTPCEKSHRSAAKALALGIHLLVVDLLQPTGCDPRGVHGALWKEVADDQFIPPAGRLLALAAYESTLTIRAYIEPVAAGIFCRTCPCSCGTAHTSWCRWRRRIRSRSPRCPCAGGAYSIRRLTEHLAGVRWHIR